jgi:hypothetical protein
MILGAMLDVFIVVCVACAVVAPIVCDMGSRENCHELDVPMWAVIRETERAKAGRRISRMVQPCC